MAVRTVFAGLTKLAPGESPWADGGTVFERNVETIDHFLRQVVEHRHDAHPALVGPTVAPALTTQATGGELPADTTIYVAYTAIDADGGETVASPVAQIDTPPPAGLPAPFTAIADYTAGDLPDGTYYYVLAATDGAGGETPPSDPVSVPLVEGHANGRVMLSGFTAAIAGATGWRLYRAVNGGDYGFLAAGATDTYTDDTSVAADPQLPPPDDLSNSTAATAQVSATVAAADLPANTVTYRVYASTDTALPRPSLVGEWPVADAGTAHAVTTLALTDEQPPPVSTSKGGAGQVRATTDIDWTGYAAGHTIEDESIVLPARAALDFQGAGVTATDDAANDKTVVTVPGGGGGGMTLEDEGVALTARTTLDFQGAGVTATDDAVNGKTVVTIPGGSALVISDEGTNLPPEPTLRFIGAGVTATDQPAGAATYVTIPGGRPVVTPVYSDDFSVDNSVNWFDSGGLQVTGGQLQATGVGVDGTALMDSFRSEQEVALAVVASAGATDIVGAIVKGDDATDFLVAQVENRNTLSIVKRVGAVYTTLKTIAIAQALPLPYYLHATVRGNDVAVAVYAAPVSAQDLAVVAPIAQLYYLLSGADATAYSGSKYPGVRIKSSDNSVRVDDFKVYSPSRKA